MQDEKPAKKMILQIIEQERDNLREAATAVADRFWSRHFEQRNVGPIETWGSYGVRVRPRKYGITIEWFQIIFYGPKGSRKVTHNYLRRGRGNRYPLSTFRYAKDWEKEAIQVAEEHFGQMRAKSEWLAKLGRLLGQDPDLPTQEPTD